jgi:hypothetical protein
MNHCCKSPVLGLLLLASLITAACRSPRGTGDTKPGDGPVAAREAAAPRGAAGEGAEHDPTCVHPPFALSVTDLASGALAVAILSPEGTPVLAGEWDSTQQRFRADTLVFLLRYPAELVAAPDRTLDFTQELAPEAVAELAELGGDAHRARLVQGFSGDARLAADQMALAAASIGSLLSRAAVVRDLVGEDGGACGAAPGFFPRACAEHANCYASFVDAEGPARSACDAALLQDLAEEATFVSEPFVPLVHGAAVAFGWRAWPVR